MREPVIKIVFATVGIIHLLPVAGVIGTATLERLYGVDGQISSDAVLLLLRHRAVLFGIVGALMLYAVSRPEVRGFAGACGLVSMLSFVALAAGSDVGPELLRVFWIDAVLSVAFAAALIWRAFPA